MDSWRHGFWRDAGVGCRCLCICCASRRLCQAGEFADVFQQDTKFDAHRRLRYLLLFALRTALILLLALAFARPFFRTKPCWPATSCCWWPSTIRSA